MNNMINVFTVWIGASHNTPKEKFTWIATNESFPSEDSFFFNNGSRSFGGECFRLENLYTRDCYLFFYVCMANTSAICAQTGKVFAECGCIVFEASKREWNLNDVYCTMLFAKNAKQDLRALKDLNSHHSNAWFIINFDYTTLCIDNKDTFDDESQLDGSDDPNWDCVVFVREFYLVGLPCHSRQPFMCMDTKKHSLYIKKFMLNVNGVETTADRFIHTSGLNLIFSCTAETNFLTSNLSITKDGRFPQIWLQNSSSLSLVKHNIDCNDIGQYTCQIEDIGKRIIHIKYFYVWLENCGPRVCQKESQEHKVSMSDMTNVTLKICLFMLDWHSFSKTDIALIKDSKRIPVEFQREYDHFLVEKQTPITSILHVQLFNVSFNDVGYYELRVYFNSGHSTIYNFGITGFYYFKNFAQDHNERKMADFLLLENGTNLDLVCTSEPYSIPSNMSITKDGRFRQVWLQNSSSLSLVKKNIDCNDIGEYTCEIENIVHTKIHRKHIYVWVRECGPKVCQRESTVYQVLISDITNVTFKICIFTLESLTISKTYMILTKDSVRFPLEFKRKYNHYLGGDQAPIKSNLHVELFNISLNDVGYYEFKVYFHNGHSINYNFSITGKGKLAHSVAFNVFLHYGIAIILIVMLAVLGAFLRCFVFRKGTPDIVIDTIDDNPLDTDKCSDEYISVDELDDFVNLDILSPYDTTEDISENITDATSSLAQNIRPLIPPKPTTKLGNTCIDKKQNLTHLQVHQPQAMSTKKNNVSSETMFGVNIHDDDIHNIEVNDLTKPDDKHASSKNSSVNSNVATERSDCNESSGSNEHTDESVNNEGAYSTENIENICQAYSEISNYSFIGNYTTGHQYLQFKKVTNENDSIKKLASKTTSVELEGLHLASMDVTLENNNDKLSLIRLMEIVHSMGFNDYITPKDAVYAMKLHDYITPKDVIYKMGLQDYITPKDQDYAFGLYDYSTPRDVVHDIGLHDYISPKRAEYSMGLNDYITPLDITPDVLMTSQKKSMAENNYIVFDGARDTTYKADHYVVFDGAENITDEDLLYIEFDGAEIG